jgi:hypothetical protein
MLSERLGGSRLVALDRGSARFMAGHIVIECDVCGDELQLSEDHHLVVTYAEMFVFTAAHEDHAPFAVHIRASDVNSSAHNRGDEA